MRVSCVVSNDRSFTKTDDTLKVSGEIVSKKNCIVFKRCKDQNLI